MRGNIYIDSHPTKLRLYAGVMTTFQPPVNQLVCANVIVLAENSTEASALIAMEFPHYELQTLTCISDLPWFHRLFLDGDNPTIKLMQSFVIGGVEEVPRSLLDDLLDGSCDPP